MTQEEKAGRTNNSGTYHVFKYSIIQLPEWVVSGKLWSDDS
jgi:hypothetical protein